MMKGGSLEECVIFMFILIPGMYQASKSWTKVWSRCYTNWEWWIRWCHGTASKTETLIVLQCCLSLLHVFFSVDLLLGLFNFLWFYCKALFCYVCPMICLVQSFLDLMSCEVSFPASAFCNSFRYMLDIKHEFYAVLIQFAVISILGKVAFLTSENIPLN